ncbi:MAG: 50S ribosomal protein L17 [Chlorobi bacterium]|nr:50S ribosomal protein L17 [Chlorobiota bacterium]
MRHRKGFNHLGRTNTHRKAMLTNMASSLIIHKRIRTTTAKAKALRIYIEPLLTKSKEDTTHSRRIVFRYLQDKEAVTELFREVSPKIADRPGGYTRILRTGNRLGDNADMCIIELVDFNENMLAASAEAKAKTTRRGRRGKKKTETEGTAAETKVEDKTTAPVADTEDTAQENKPEVKDEKKDIETKVSPEEDVKKDEEKKEGV